MHCTRLPDAGQLALGWVEIQKKQICLVRAHASIMHLLDPVPN